MNNHIIPKHHLKQFANPYGCIFTYPNPDAKDHKDAQCISKGGGRVIDNTASEHGFYTDETETLLGHKFEREGSKIAQKIIDKEDIELKERDFFATYLASYFFRVPSARALATRIYSDSVGDLNKIDYFMSLRESDPSIHEFDFFAILNDPSQTNDRINHGWEDSIKAGHDRIHQALLQRDWWVAEAISDEYFITSNNPLFFSPSTGMSDLSVQITFPLSQKMALIMDGSLRSSSSYKIDYHQVSVFQHNQVDLINKRTADNSSQLYSPKRDPYVQILVGHTVTNPPYIQRST